MWRSPLSRAKRQEQALTEALIGGRGVLLIGPNFGEHCAAKLGPSRWLGAAAEGTNGLPLEDRIELAGLEAGTPAFLDRVARTLPPVEAIRSGLSDPIGPILSAFEVVIDCSPSALSLAGLMAERTPFSLWQGGGLGRKTALVRLWPGLAHAPRKLGADGLEQWRVGAERLLTQVRDLSRQGAVVAIGFGPRSATLRWLLTQALPPTDRGATRVYGEAAGPWARYWSDRKAEYLGRAWLSALGVLIEGVAAARSPLRANLVSQLEGAVESATQSMLSQLEAFAWTDDEAPRADAVEPGSRALHSLARRGVSPPAAWTARSAEIMARAKRSGPAEGLLDLVWRRAREGALPATASLDLGRTLCHLGYETEAVPHFETALKGDLSRGLRTDALAWLARCALTRIDALDGARRADAAIEVVAAFLTRYRPLLPLVSVEPTGPGHLRAAYFANLRLGRIMAAAGEMARSSGRIYVEQAIELLRRAIGLDGERPEPWMALAPLLVDRQAEWRAVLDGAPKGIKRRFS